VCEYLKDVPEEEPDECGDVVEALGEYPGVPHVHSAPYAFAGSYIAYRELKRSWGALTSNMSQS